MASERILITGANGFVGRHLIRHLLASSSGAQPLIAAIVMPSELEQAVEWAGTSIPVTAFGRLKWSPADLTVPGEAKRIIDALKPDSVAHLAARASGADSDREGVFQVNVAGTRMLLEAISARAKPARTLLISTGYAYGPTSPERPAVETDSLAVTGAYGAYTDSKIAMEELADPFSENTIVARSFSHTGPGQTPIFAIPSFARQIARIERGLDPPIISVGNLEALRDMLDVRDVVRAYELILRHGITGEVYNVASGRPYKMQLLLNMLIGQVNVPIQIVQDPARLRPADIACSTGDSAKLRERTGWQPEIPIEQTMKDTLDYWRGSVGAPFTP